MKQELKFRDDPKASSSPATAAAAAAAAASRSGRAFRGRRESPRSDSATAPSPVLKTRPTKPPPPPPPPSETTRIRIRSSTAAAAAAAAAIHANKMRPSNDHHDHRPATAGRIIAEQLAQLRPEAKELQRRRLEESERVVRELTGELSALRAELQSLQGSNSQLELDNKRLAEDLLAAQQRIQQLEMQNLNCQDARKFAAADKLEQPKVEDDTDTDTDTDRTRLMRSAKRAQLPELAKHKDLNAKSSPTPPPPPPPPPPLSRPPPPLKSNSVNKATALVELYNSLTKRNGKDSKGSGGYSNSVGANPHHSIVGELQNRSGHLLAIKADVRTKGEFIRHLIDRVRSAAYTSMDDVLAFVDWLDRELSTLSDERAVLKHFDWPERKADALREAAFEYRDIKRVEAEAASFSDDPSSPCEATLKKISNLLEKLEKSMNRLVKLRNSSMLSYKECKIPTEWMLDSGVVSTMKLATMKLAKVYMKRVVMELDTNSSPERETAQEALLLQSVRFAYRAHQFAGGLDSETMRAFEQLREKVRSNGRGSKVLIPGMVLSERSS